MLTNQLASLVKKETYYMEGVRVEEVKTKSYQ